MTSTAAEKERALSRIFSEEIVAAEEEEEEEKVAMVSKSAVTDGSPVEMYILIEVDCVVEI